MPCSGVFFLFKLQSDAGLSNPWLGRKGTTRVWTLWNTRFYSNGIGCENLTQHQAACQQWGIIKECLHNRGICQGSGCYKHREGSLEPLAPGSPEENFNTDQKSTRQIQILWKLTSRGRQEGTLERSLNDWFEVAPSWSHKHNFPLASMQIIKVKST